MRLRKILLLLSTLICIPNFAEQITIQDATELALKNNKNIRIQMLELEKSKDTVNKAWKSAFFTVNYNASVSRYFKEVGNINDIYNSGISLSQPIYTGGAVKSAINLGKESLKLSELTLEKVKKDVLLSTTQAYINVYDAQNMYAVYELSRRSLEESYKIQKEKYDLRMITKPEMLESERALKEIEAQLITQESNIIIAKETLGNIIGKKAEEIEIVPFGADDKFSDRVNLTEDLEKLKMNNTEYLMSVNGINIAKENVNIEKASTKPKVNLVANYGATNVTQFSELAKEKNYNGTVSLNFSMNLIDWGANKLNVEIAKKSENIAEIKAEQLLDDMKVNLKNMYYKLVSLEKSLEVLKLAQERAEEVYKFEKERYEHRLITLNDLIKAESNVRQSRAVYLSTKLNYYYLVLQYSNLLN